MIPVLIMLEILVSHQDHIYIPPSYVSIIITALFYMLMALFLYRAMKRFFGEVMYRLIDVTNTLVHSGMMINELRKDLERAQLSSIADKTNEIVQELDDLRVHAKERIEDIVKSYAEAVEQVKSRLDTKIKALAKTAEGLDEKVDSRLNNFRQELKNDYSKLLSHILYVEKHLGEIKHRLDAIERKLVELEELVEKTHEEKNKET